MLAKKYIAFALTLLFVATYISASAVEKVNTGMRGGEEESGNALWYTMPKNYS